MAKINTSQVRRNGFQIGPKQEGSAGRSVKTPKRVSGSGAQSMRNLVSPPNSGRPARGNGGTTVDPVLARYAEYASGGGKVSGQPNALRTEPDPRIRGGRRTNGATQSGGPTS